MDEIVRVCHLDVCLVIVVVVVLCVVVHVRIEYSMRLLSRNRRLVRNGERVLFSLELPEREEEMD